MRMWKAQYFILKLTQINVSITKKLKEHSERWKSKMLRRFIDKIKNSYSRNRIFDELLRKKKIKQL